MIESRSLIMAGQASRETTVMQRRDIGTEAPVWTGNCI